MTLPLSEQASQFRLGIYEHYKGNRYKILTLARLEETLEEVVVYQCALDPNLCWVRPLAMFLEKVTLEGKGEVDRFQLIEIHEKNLRH